jgi:hypothetical protein
VTTTTSITTTSTILICHTIQWGSNVPACTVFSCAQCGSGPSCSYGPSGLTCSGPVCCNFCILNCTITKGTTVICNDGSSWTIPAGSSWQQTSSC